MKIRMIVVKTDTGFQARSEEHSFHVIGSNLDELMDNIIKESRLRFDNVVEYIIDWDAVAKK